MGKWCQQRRELIELDAAGYAGQQGRKWSCFIISVGKKVRNKAGLCGEKLCPKHCAEPPGVRSVQFLPSLAVTSHQGHVFILA